MREPIGPESQDPADTVFEGRGLTKEYRVRHHGRDAYHGRHQTLVAVNDVTLSLPGREVTAVVGESGSGKSTLARLMAALESPTRGELWLGDQHIRLRGARQMRPFRRKVQMIFQDPFASLNPVHTIGYHLARPLAIHGLASGKAEVATEIERLLARVSLAPAAQFLDRYPHELSGGQRQRVAIARALAVQPQVLLADEPVSMLDVSIRMGVLNLLADLGQEQGLAILYITHDIASARYFADTVSVMYAGRLVEGGSAEDVTQEPAHPYTQVLVDAAPDPDRLQRGRRLMVRGSTPHSGAASTGCSFAPRCPQAMARCAVDAPPRFEVGPGHWATCWLYDGEPAHPAPVRIAVDRPPAPTACGGDTSSTKKTYSTKSQPEESGLSQ